MNIKCKLGLHKWKHNIEEVKNSTIRVCIRCDKEEIYYFNKWHPSLQGYSIIVPKNY